MKILVIGQYFYPEQFRINDVVKALVDFGHNVTVLTEYPNYPNGDIYEGYGFNIAYESIIFGAKIVRLKARPRLTGKINLALNYLSYWKMANHWVKKIGKQFDLIYSCQTSPVFMCLPAITAKKKFDIPFVVNVQDMWPESFMAVMHTDNKLIYKFLETISNRVYKNADKLLCSSKSFIDILRGRGINQNKLIYWPQFAEDIDTASYPCPTEFQTKYRFVFTGNVGEAQGLDKILKTAELLKDNKEVGFYLIGDGSDKQRLKEIASDKGLSNVFFIDKKPITIIPQYIKNASAGILTLAENILSKITVPAKLQMYMACGCPVICMIKGEAGEVVDDAKCGIVLDQNNAEKLANAITKFIESDESVIELYKTNGEKYAKEHFDKRMLLNKLNEEIGKLN